MAKRVDENQKEVVKVLRQLGASVLILSDVGHGCPDILIGIFGINLLGEIKNGKKSPSQRKLTEHEEKFFANWKGQVAIIGSVEEAVDLINGLQK